MVEILIQNRANVNAASDDGATPLFFAAQEGNTKMRGKHLSIFCIKIIHTIIRI